MALLSHSPRPFIRRLGAVAAVATVTLAALAGPPPAALAASRTASEQEVRAVVLLHLARFVRWPDEAFPQPDSPLVIGIYKSDELAKILTQAVRDEKIDHRPIVCRSLATPGDLEGCHLVFVGQAAVRPLAPLLMRLQSRPILLVSDAEGFLYLGGHVQFYSHSGEVKIRVAPRNLKAAQLAASSQLLRIARVD